MLISRNVWDNLMNKPCQVDTLFSDCNEKYILNYFLGNLNDDKKRKIEKFAKKNNCKIINILDRNDPFYTCGPDEFLWLEKNAYAIFTDSFHSAVFAILFHKPFVVFDRDDHNESMNSRLKTLLHKFDLESQFYYQNIDDAVMAINYDKIELILEKERKKASQFLKKSLTIKKEGKYNG